jgi:hypothetical protein
LKEKLSVRLSKRLGIAALLMSLLLLSTQISRADQRILRIAFTGDLKGHITDEYG